MSDYPETWKPVALGELADFEMGQAPPGSECNRDGVGTPFVKAGEFGAERPIIREWTTKPLKFAKETDVLICVVGATAGKLNLGANCAIGGSAAAIRPSEAIDQFYLHRFLMTRVNDLRAGSTGSAQGVISKTALAQESVPLPPLPEQRRIVAKLDRLSARSTAARDHLARTTKLATRAKQAILNTAFSGETTGEWRARTGVAIEDAVATRSNIEAQRLELVATAGKLRRGKGTLPDHHRHPVEISTPEEWELASLEEVSSPLRLIQYGIRRCCVNQP